MNIKRDITAICKGLIFLKHVIIAYGQLILLIHALTILCLKIFLNLNFNSDED
jgi:hypothetical protein